MEVPPSASRPQRIQVSYQELLGRANALAHALSTRIQQPDQVVAILLPRNSEHLYLAQLAVMKAGAAFTCIDPIFPDEQLQNILADCRPVVLLSDAAGLARARNLPTEIPALMNVRDKALGQRAAHAPPSWLSPHHLAYLIYTSGTTGRRKGVMIEHASIVSLVQGDLQELDVTPQDRVGQNSSAAYDSSVEETWFALAAGATLVVMDDETTRLGPDLVPWLRRERITMFCPPPTMLRATACAHPERDLPDLRLLHVGGEALPADVAQRWSVGRRLVNDYGPTECTVTALRGVIEPGAPITIGAPVPGVQAWVLNDRLEEVPPGSKGELCLGGRHLARGYWNDESLTARKFVHHPRLGRLYRTGDLVHRDAAGNYHCHGRIDSQVKIRGYRIELEDIEARLTHMPGVREAACTVQTTCGHPLLVGFVIPTDADGPPCLETLIDQLRHTLPEYMVPARLALVSQVPRTISGKLDRKNLPVLATHGTAGVGQEAQPQNSMEEKLAQAMRTSLGLSEPVARQHDFFHDLGGDSLQAALLISLLRNDPMTAALTVRDLYEARTVANLAKKILPIVAAAKESSASARPDSPAAPEKSRPLLATSIQVVWLALALLLGAPVAYGLVFHVLPTLVKNLGLAPLALLSPVFFAVGTAAYTLAAVGFAVFLKKMLIGRYRPRRSPVWSGFYVRHWIVQQAARLIPWRMLQGTHFQATVLRLLGARIGQRLHLHRGVSLLQGGWDLLDLGDDVTLSQDATVGLVEYEDGHLVFRPVRIGNGCTLDIRAGVGGDTILADNSYLAPLSYLMPGEHIPGGQRWDGVPAQPAGQAPASPEPNPGSQDLSPFAFGVALGLVRAAVSFFVNAPSVVLLFALSTWAGIDAEAALQWLSSASLGVMGLLLVLTVVLVHVPLSLLFSAFAMRLMGRVRPGVIRRWSLAYVRVDLKTALVESANSWLLGSLLWPVWLRLAGMKIGRGCEMSTIIDTVPELVEIGPGSFFADGIYLAGPRVHQGTVTLAPTRIGQEVFLGNNALIPMGQTIPDGVLLGVSTVANDQQLRPDSGWFGHPPFELPQREVVECDRRFTHAPGWWRFLNRVFWEMLRFALPLAPLAFVLVWFTVLASVRTSVSLPVLLLCVVPALDFMVRAGMCLFGLALKWALLGRVKPGVHPLYSSWCSRWEFHYIAWDLYVIGPLSALEGTLLLNWFLRAMGMKIGKRVVLGPGFAGTIDHDMLEFADGATVNCLFQAHTFEDRVLKIDRVTIRRQATVGTAAVLLYGADIGEHTRVVPHSVVMKHERLLPQSVYVGSPTHRTCQEPITVISDPC